MTMKARGATTKLDSVAIYDQLRSDILSCRLPPGAPIYEQDLGRRFGVSKSPVREALMRLRDQNLVEVKARSGHWVRPISLSEVDEMYEIRMVYEQACVDLAIKHCNADMLAELAKLAACKDVTSIEKWIPANRRFHDGLARASGNRRFAQIASNFNGLFDRFTHISATRMAHPRDFSGLVAEHQALVEAIARRDRKAAAKLIRRHVEASHKRTQAAFNTPMFVA
jgi:DNA-binding GntR family transcriptional regulator